ncbi:MAG: hypothetical protein D6781_12780 [Verrucomicrobia bacterium]|nr:MAG: hypothetical protein D6781_12780 [Verrucomicrobiota bacterium]
MTLFWIFLGAVILVLVLLFFDAVREHPLGAMLLMASAVYFVWRAFTFLSGERTDDVLIWKILGITAGTMAVVGFVGSRLQRRDGPRR